MSAEVLAGLNEYLLEDWPERSLGRMLANLGGDVVLCGHTQLPSHRRIGSVHLINVGSVGKPKGGDPRACYVPIELDGDVTATSPRVAYDVKAAARAIEATDLPHEFASVLRTGGR